MLHQKVYGLLYNVIDIIYQCDRKMLLLQLLLSHDKVFIKRHNRIQNETVKHIYCYICSITHSCQEIENIMQTEKIQPLHEFLKLIFRNCETNQRKTQINCHDMSSLV